MPKIVGILYLEVVKASLTATGYTAPLQVQNSAKTSCAPIRHTQRFLTGSARDFHVTETFKNGDDEAKLNYIYMPPSKPRPDGGISHP